MVCAEAALIILPIGFFSTFFLPTKLYSPCVYHDIYNEMLDAATCPNLQLFNLMKQIVFNQLKVALHIS
jgi:hypothetical protein